MTQIETQRTNHAAIADAAFKIIEQHPDGLLLSRLGQELRREIGEDFRERLGSKRLSDVLRQHVGAGVSFEGHGPEMRVFPRGAGSIVEAPVIHFQPRFWAAFAKPIESSDKRRWLQIEDPFQFQDLDSNGVAPAGSHEVQASFIPSVGLPRPERAHAIVLAIQAWCAANSLDPERFRSRPRQRASADVGLAALRNLVEAVPEAERANHSISLALIGRLLGCD